MWSISKNIKIVGTIFHESSSIEESIKCLFDLGYPVDEVIDSVKRMCRKSTKEAQSIVSSHPLYSDAVKNNDNVSFQAMLESVEVGEEEEYELYEYHKNKVQKYKDEFKIGDIYTDVFDHPTLCMEVEIEDDDICLSGISLFDGTYPRSCSVLHSAPEKISFEEAWKRKLEFEKAKRPKHCKIDK